MRHCRANTSEEREIDLAGRLGGAGGVRDGRGGREYDHDPSRIDALLGQDAGSTKVHATNPDLRPERLQQGYSETDEHPSPEAMRAAMDGFDDFVHSFFALIRRRPMTRPALTLVLVAFSACTDRIVADGAGLVVDIDSGRPITGASVKLYLVPDVGSSLDSVPPTVDTQSDESGMFTLASQDRINLSLLRHLSHGSSTPTQVVQVRRNREAAAFRVSGLPVWQAVFLMSPQEQGLVVEASAGLPPTSSECQPLSRRLLFATDWSGFSVSKDRARDVFSAISRTLRAESIDAMIRCGEFVRKDDTVGILYAVTDSCRMNFSVTSGKALLDTKIRPSELSGCKGREYAPFAADALVFQTGGDRDAPR